MEKSMNLELNEKKYTVKLNGSITAAEFMQLTPFETSLSPSGNHCYGPIPQRLSISEEYNTSNPRKGGVYYADHMQAIAIYYGDSGSIKPFMIVYIGDIHEDLSDLNKTGRRISLKVKA
jgi:hypothetical protein